MTYGVTSALVGGEWSASRPGRFTSEDSATGTFWIGCEVGGVEGVKAYMNYNKI
jgi:hypothetical protein